MGGDQKYLEEQDIVPIQIRVPCNIRMDCHANHRTNVLDIGLLTTSQQTHG